MAKTKYYMRNYRAMKKVQQPSTVAALRNGVMPDTLPDHDVEWDPFVDALDVIADNYTPTAELAKYQAGRYPDGRPHVRVARLAPGLNTGVRNYNYGYDVIVGHMPSLTVYLRPQLFAQMTDRQHKAYEDYLVYHLYQRAKQSGWGL